MNRAVLLSLIGSLFLPALARAQDEREPLSEAIFVSAKLEEAVPPKFPSAAAATGREGWVMLSYVVTSEGEIASPMIEDSSGGEEFETSALRMLEQWTYEPAMLNGTPVDQSMVHYRVTFLLRNGSRGASRAFRRSYGEIQQLIDDGNLENVEELLTDLRFSEKNNLYEDASFWWLNYRYLEAVGSNDLAEKMRSLRLAIGTSETYLPGDVLVFASLQLYQLQLADADYSAALATFEKLQDSKDARKSDRFESTLAAMKSSYEQILARSNGDQVLALDAEIGVNGYWFHDLLRRSFSIGDVIGTGEIVEIRCQRRFAEYSFSDASTWTIPESWGSCGIYVRGDVGTTFTLFEWPAEG